MPYIGQDLCPEAVDYSDNTSVYRVRGAAYLRLSSHTPISNKLNITLHRLYNNRKIFLYIRLFLSHVL